ELRECARPDICDDDIEALVFRNGIYDLDREPVAACVLGRHEAAIRIDVRCDDAARAEAMTDEAENARAGSNVEHGAELALAQAVALFGERHDRATVPCRIVLGTKWSEALEERSFLFTRDDDTCDRPRSRGRGTPAEARGIERDQELGRRWRHVLPTTSP